MIEEIERMHRLVLHWAEYCREQRVMDENIVEHLERRKRSSLQQFDRNVFDR